MPSSGLYRNQVHECTQEPDTWMYTDINAGKTLTNLKKRTRIYHYLLSKRRPKWASQSSAQENVPQEALSFVEALETDSLKCRLTS